MKTIIKEDSEVVTNSDVNNMDCIHIHGVNCIIDVCVKEILYTTPGSYYMIVVDTDNIPYRALSRIEEGSDLISTVTDIKLSVIRDIVREMMTDNRDFTFKFNDGCEIKSINGGKSVGGHTFSVAQYTRFVLTDLIMYSLLGDDFELSGSPIVPLLEENKPTKSDDPYVLYTYQEFIIRLIKVSRDHFDMYITALDIVNKYNINMNIDDIRRYLSHSMSEEYIAIRDELDELEIAVDINNVSKLTPIHQLIVRTMTDKTLTKIAEESDHE